MHRDWSAQTIASDPTHVSPFFNWFSTNSSTVWLLKWSGVVGVAISTARCWTIKCLLHKLQRRVNEHFTVCVSLFSYSFALHFLVKIAACKLLHSFNAIHLLWNMTVTRSFRILSVDFSLFNFFSRLASSLIIHSCREKWNSQHHFSVFNCCACVLGKWIHLVHCSLAWKHYFKQFVDKLSLIKTSCSLSFVRRCIALDFKFLFMHYFVLFNGAASECRDKLVESIIVNNIQTIGQI